jgi:putative ABC transport system permease protein
MDVGERLRQAWESIADNPRRVAASAMGVFWGAAAIVLLLAWGTGFRDYMRSELGRYGRPSIFVIPGSTSSGFPGYRPGVPVRASRRDAEIAERENSELVAAILAEHWSEGRVLVEARGKVRRLDMTATDHRFDEFRRFQIGAGRFLEAGDVARSRPVAVLGYEAARELFDDPAAAVGRTLRIEGEPFELIGVFDEKSGRQYTNTNRPENRLLIVPNSSAESRLGYDEQRVRIFTVFPREGADTDEAFRAVVASLARRAGFHPDDTDAVRHFDLSHILGLLDLMHVGFTLFIGVAGTITLLVGGVGIANYHLAMLAERSVEIAVAKAIGARSRTLVLQSVLESTLVSGTAAALGLAVGLAGGLGLSHLAPSGMFPVPVISATAIGITASALVGVAIVAALVPALRVRRMDVSTALREAP